MLHVPSELLDRVGLLLERYVGFATDIPQRDALVLALTARVRATGCTDFNSYHALLDSEASRDELSSLVDEIVVSESHFFRGEDHWRAFEEYVVPELIRERGGVRRLRILCAGCAAGEEPHTVAMVLAERMADRLADWQVEIVGVDVSSRALTRARAGRYTQWALRGVPDNFRQRYFRETGNQFELVESIRRRVRFERRNLLEEPEDAFWSTGFDLIFCRNVFIYFTSAAMQRVVDRFSRVLRPGGFLFLGHTETLRGISRAFNLRSVDETFFYQLRNPDESVEADPLHELWQQIANSPSTSAALPPMVECAPEDSWVETTRQVSERIDGLLKTVASRRETPAASASASTLDRQRAMALYQQERYGELAHVLALPAAAGDRDAQLLLAATLTNSGPLEQAEQACRTLIAADEFNGTAHYLYALCREHAGDLEGAELHLQTAIYLDPGFSMPPLQLGRLSRRRGRLERARRYLRDAQGLLLREEASRLLLFGGGFSREALSTICCNELIECGVEL